MHGGAADAWLNSGIIPGIIQWKQGGDGNKDNGNNENNKKNIYKHRDDMIWEKLSEAPQLVTDDAKRKYKAMMHIIMIRGKKASAEGNTEKEKQIWATWARAKRWQHLMRAYAHLARKYEGLTRRQAPIEEIIYSAHDRDGPTPDSEIDAIIEQWEQDEALALSNGTQREIEAIFPELEEAEMKSFEWALKRMGLIEKEDWSVGTSFFDPLNKPWGRPPEDDESGGAAGGTHVKTAMNNLQIYMMQGGGGESTTPTSPKTHWTINK